MIDLKETVFYVELISHVIATSFPDMCPQDATFRRFVRDARTLQENALKRILPRTVSKHGLILLQYPMRHGSEMIPIRYVKFK